MGWDMLEPFMIATVTGICSGLVAWGGMRVELRWIRSDVNHALERIARLEGILLARRETDERISGHEPHKQSY